MAKLPFHIILILLLSSCATQNSVTKYQPQFNFSDVQTYSMYELNSKFGELQNLGHQMRNSIELLIERKMEAKGYKYAAIEEADVIVSYHLVGTDRTELRQYDLGTKYCAYCLKYNGDVQDYKKKQAEQGRVGNLILDLINTQNKRSVWRSSYPLKIKVKDNSAEVQEKLQQGIHSMLNDIPK